MLTEKLNQPEVTRLTKFQKKELVYLFEEMLADGIYPSMLLFIMKVQRYHLMSDDMDCICGNEKDNIATYWSTLESIMAVPSLEE